MTRAPSVHLPSFPVMRLPNCGLAIWREKKRLIGVMKKPAFSMKNGRFSGKKTAKRWLIEEMIVGQQSVRNKLNVSSGRHVFQATDRRELLRQSCDTLSHIGPVVV